MEKWKTETRELILGDKFTKIYKNHFILPNNLEFPSWYTVERIDYVLVLAHDTTLNKFLIEKQYRPATDAFMYEVTAGAIDEGESPIECAQRELEEETGYICSNFKILAKTSPLPGLVECWAYIVYAEIESKSVAKPDISEQIESKLMSLEEIQNLIQLGEIFDLGSLAAFGAFNIKNMIKK